MHKIPRAELLDLAHHYPEESSAGAVIHGLLDLLNESESRTMPRSEPKTDADIRLEKLQEPFLAALEAAAMVITDVRKGRKALAVMIMFDADHPDNVVGYRIGVVDLFDKARPPA